MMNLTKIREEKGMTKTELHTLSGISLSTICSIESGRLYPYPKARREISRVLEVGEDILFQEVSEE